MADKTSIPNLQFINISTPDNPRITLIQNSLIGSGAVKLSSGITDKDGNAPTLEMMLTFKNTEGKYMQATVPAGGFTDSTTITGMKRGIAKSGIDLETEVTALDIDLLEGSEVVSAIPAQLFQLVFDALRQQIGSSAKWILRPTFSEAGIIADRVFADATARDAAITSPQNGDRCYNTATGTFQKYQAGAWTDDATGTTPNASTTVAGKGEIATSAESKAGTDTGGTGAKMWVLPSDIAKNIQDAVYSYAADGGATDDYAITLTPAVSAYVTGQVFFFKANTANTGAATLNVNTLGAKTIKKLHDQDLEDNDIESGQMVMVMYDGTNFQMFSPLGTQLTTAQKNTLTGGRSSDADDEHTHGAIERMLGCGNYDNKNYYNFEIPWLISTNIPSGEWWTNSGFTISTGTFGGRGLSGAAGATLITTNGILIGDASIVNFSRTNILICEFDLAFDNSTPSANEGGFGFVATTTVLQDSDDQTADSACFTYDGTNLYAHTADAGVGHTNTAIDLTGIDLSDMNRYRIEFDPNNSEVRFYINEILKATNTTNLPNSQTIKWGIGKANNNKGEVELVTNIYVSQER